MDTIRDLERSISCPYTHLPENPEEERPLRRPLKSIIYGVSGFLLLSLVVVLIGTQRYDEDGEQKLEMGTSAALEIKRLPRGVMEGVSRKSFRLSNGDDDDDGVSYPWTNDMLDWQRTGFHFQPQKNWMNGKHYFSFLFSSRPLFYKGWYHFFYQYNPVGAVWGNIVWGHAVSRDLIKWNHLPLAMVPDQWYDYNGVWTGSATILPDGSIVMLYTGSTNESVQVQNLAFPADPSDPLLVNWVKYAGNPVLVPPPGIGIKDFRDPTTAWVAPNGNWRFTIGSRVGTTGVSLVYETSDFLNYTLLDGWLHKVNGTGMWECIDFYPVSTTIENGLDTSVNGPNIKHVMKASLDNDKNDYYALGTYDLERNVWTPDNPELDVGIGMRYDYGKYYASKTFYDQNKQRRVLWGWIKETDSERSDIAKGWASLQGVPRTVVFDKKTKSNILQWPVHEIESLRLGNKMFNNIELKSGSVVPLNVGKATQLDITAVFEIDSKALEGVAGADVSYNCSTSNGAAGKGVLGPFGLLVLADESRSEQTVVYFYIAKGNDNNLKTFFCTDESRSSKASDVDKQIYGSVVPVLDGEKLSVRILVDHSIVEAFAQGGRTCITSRVYPTKAINNNARVFLFNNATGASVTATSVKIWQMNSTFDHPQV
ncbi:hypothetical protein GIB67_040656 [Kingdonia uniflora]|uniref:Beta-fructofuranosidase n=1 Tax=Kingdonia uniflora TaxID=39325 RepID=A0A7J7KU76_9MAGN|nr:hypothetical protein GIB67_040656 [Kingdonia uniflora]